MACARCELRNRDAAVCEAPDRFDIHRNPLNHVAFVYGCHQCLARLTCALEMHFSLETLFRRLRGCASPRRSRTIPFKSEIAVHGVQSGSRHRGSRSGQTGVRLRVKIDLEKCVVAGHAVLARPGVFAQDDADGIVILLQEPPPPELE